MFEKFNTFSIFIEIPNIFSLYSVGKFTGLSVESGDGITQISPILDTKYNLLPSGEIDG